MNEEIVLALDAEGFDLAGKLDVYQRLNGLCRQGAITTFGHQITGWDNKRQPIKDEPLSQISPLAWMDLAIFAEGARSQQTRNVTWVDLRLSVGDIVKHWPISSVADDIPLEPNEAPSSSDLVKLAEVTLSREKPTGIRKIRHQKAEEECEARIRQLDSQMAKTKSYAEWRKEALDRNRDLTGRAFHRAWLKYAPLEMRQPGAKKRPKSGSP